MTKILEPSVSVIMPTLNVEKYVRESIDSIIDQTFKNFEFIIIDDGSTDSSKLIINSYSDDRVVFVENEHNIGLTKSLNKGIELAKGEYIARMDADDISELTRFEKQYNYLINNPKCDVLGTWGNLIDENGDFVRSTSRNKTHEDIIATIFFYNPIIHASVLMKREIFKQIQYSSDFIYAQDYKLWLDLILNGMHICNLPEVLISYRVHCKNITVSDNSKQDFYAMEALRVYLNEMYQLKINSG